MHNNATYVIVHRNGHVRERIDLLWGHLEALVVEESTRKQRQSAKTYDAFNGKPQTPGSLIFGQYE